MLNISPVTGPHRLTGRWWTARHARPLALTRVSGATAGGHGTEPLQVETHRWGAGCGSAARSPADARGADQHAAYKIQAPLAFLLRNAIDLEPWSGAT